MKENIYDNMSMKLMELLDGELPSDMEPGVFDALGKDEDLQSEFRDHIAIREAVRKDVTAFTPPPELAASVFKRVGLDYPTAVIPPKRFAWKRYSALLVLLLMAGSGAALINNQGKSDAKVAVIGSFESNESKPKAVETTNALVNNSETANTKSAISPTKKSYVHANTGSNSLSMKSVGESEKATKVEALGLVVNDIAKEEAPAIAKPDFKQTEFANYRFAENQSALANYSASPFKTLVAARNSIELSNFNLWASNSASAGSVWSVRMRGIYALSSAERQLQSGSAKTFSIGIFTSLKVDDNLSIGMEYGMEPFSQVFTNSSDASGVKYDQKPTLSWIAISARYEVSQLAVEGFTPAAQLSFAGSDLGPVVKGYVGVSYPLINSVGVNLGVESSSLFYKNQGVFNSTQKFSLTGGICVKL